MAWPLTAVVLLAATACVPTYRDTLVTPETTGRVLRLDGRPVVGAELYFEAGPHHRAWTSAEGYYRLPETRRRALDLVLPATGVMLIDYTLVAKAEGYRPVRVRVQAPTWGGAAVNLPPIVLSASEGFPEMGPGLASPADLAAPADCAREVWEDAAALWRVARQAAAHGRSGGNEQVRGRLVLESAYHHARRAWDAVQPTCERRPPYTGWTRAGTLEARLNEEAYRTLQVVFVGE